MAIGPPVVHAEATRVIEQEPASTPVALKGVVLGLIVALVAAIGFGASPASGALAKLENGSMVSYQPLRGATEPFDLAFTNLDYNGGRVMPSNTNYTIYWSPTGLSAYPADYQPGVDRYFGDLEADSGNHENVDSVATQYKWESPSAPYSESANYASHFGGAFIDTAPYPANGCKKAPKCLTKAQVEAELNRFVVAHGLPTDLEHEYFLLTPPGLEGCLDAKGTSCSVGSTNPKFCAYHYHVNRLIYSNDPYVTGKPGCDDGNHPNGTTSDGVLNGGLSHEHNESITDPQPFHGWTDLGGKTSENGDKCRTATGPAINTTAYGPYNQVINGHPYWYQEEWSNQSRECKQRLTFSGEEPTATFTSKDGPNAQTEVIFDATGSSVPGHEKIAHYNWQFNDGPGVVTPVETNGPTVSHVFPGPGTYRVALTVFAEDGTSIGTAREVYDAPGWSGTLKFNADELITEGQSAGSELVYDTFFRLDGTREAISFGLNQESTVQPFDWSAKFHANIAPHGCTPPDNYQGWTEDGEASGHVNYVPEVSGAATTIGPVTPGTHYLQFAAGGTDAMEKSIILTDDCGVQRQTAAYRSSWGPARFQACENLMTTPDDLLFNVHGTFMREAEHCVVSMTRYPDANHDGIQDTPPPTVTKVTPTRGTALGGNLVTITGTNFGSANAVKFGTAESEDFTVLSSTSILAVAPEDSPSGTVGVTVSTRAGGPASAVSQYTVVPAVASVSPNAGPKAGGTSVTVFGRGFATESGATVVRFGTAKAKSVTCSSRACAVIAPPHAVGPVDVKVTVNNLSSAKNTLADQYTYN
jgi:hypothetical protein